MDYKQFRKRLCERLGRNSADIDALVEGLSIVLRQSCAELDSVAVPAFRHIRPADKHTEAIVDDLSTGKEDARAARNINRIPSGAMLLKRLRQ